MLKNHLKIAALILPLTLIMGCSKDKIIEHPVKKDVITFEREYINSLNYSSDNSIKLIGFKKIKVTSQEIAEFAHLSKDYRDKLSNYYYDEADGSMRIYFPVEAALVENTNNTLVEANAMGEITIENAQLNNEQLSVVGRKQTDLIIGVEGNVIRDGVIYLAEKNKSDHRIGNTFVFDFGYKMMMEHHHAPGTQSMEKASCMRNHGGWRNCSNAFGIFKGRCPFNANVCMDYNGWFTNCVNGKFSNFPGSDCDYALGAGHCWNEVM
jgi:hypothetical protein